MIEVKFRAWEKTSESMVYDVHTVSRKRIIGESACESFGDVLNSWEYEVMQYIGLRDENGIDIYTGDICKTLMGIVGEVVLVAGRYSIKNNDGIYKISSMPIVIGNIYENKDIKY